NASFSRYVEIVHAHGGEVASFAGDSLLACWEGDPTSARACAQALRGNELHLGLASGSIWVARLGGWFGGWELLVGGPAVREAFQCAIRARKGEVVQSGEPRIEHERERGHRSDGRGWHRGLLPRIVRERGAAPPA